MDGTRSRDTEDILEAALAQAFSPPPSRPHSIQLSDPPGTEPAASPSFNRSDDESTSADAPHEGTSSGSPDDSWKVEYEEQVKIWRAQSSAAREKAEKERKRWEEIRASEKDDAARPDASVTVVKEGHEAGWETVSNTQNSDSTVSVSHSPSLADSRDLVTGESQSQKRAPLTTSSGPTAALPRVHSHQDAESQKWEDIHSSVTSFPSMTYPERSETPSPSQNHLTPSQPAPLPTATLAIFDSTLSTRTRVKALFSSLAINMLLPFVNGVMLGFGEIFAKNVIIGWLGWKVRGPGSVAATTGIGFSTPWGQRQKPKQS